MMLKQILFVMMVFVLLSILTACNLSETSPPASDVIEESIDFDVTVEATEEPIFRTAVPEASGDTDAGAGNNFDTTNSDPITSNNDTVVDTSSISQGGTSVDVSSFCTPRTDWRTYTVVAGDTLYRIAQRVNSTTAILSDANCLPNANQLEVGQQLYVPRLPAAPDNGNNGSVDTSCRIIIRQDTPVINAPQGTGRFPIGYLEPGDVVIPVVHFEGLPYWGFWYGNIIGWVDAQPTGDCSNVSNQPPRLNDDTCRITISERIPVINAPQGTGREVLGYLLPGRTVIPVVHFEGLPYWGFWFGDVIGWIEVQPRGDCSNISDQPIRLATPTPTFTPTPLPSPTPDNICVFMADEPAAIWSQPAFDVDTLGRMTTGARYRFVEFGSDYVNGDNSGYWLRVLWQGQRAVTGYVVDNSGHLEGDCPSR